MPNESKGAICPNPKCNTKIERLIVLSDTSTTPVERYYACPHCLFKLDVTYVQGIKEARAFEIGPPVEPSRRKKEKKKKKEEPLVKPPQKEEKRSSKCPGYLGYLATLPENAPIPQKCLACPEALDCVMKTSDS